MILRKIKLLYEWQEAVIKLFNDYSSIVAEAKHKAKYGKGFRMLTSKQMVRRLLIVLAQVKAGNTSEIRQILYSLYSAKQITKEVCNNIMNSVKL